jgi:hypothetical protein
MKNSSTRLYIEIQQPESSAVVEKLNEMKKYGERNVKIQQT